MVAFDTISDLKSDLIRKSIGGACFIADITAASIAALTSATGTAPNEVITLSPLPAGYESAGYLTDDGMNFATETNSSEVASFQSTTPTRSDITAETSTLTITMQETKLQSLALFTGAATSGLVPAIGSGELRIAKPQRPSSRFYRVLSIAVDGDGDDTIYIGRYLPRAKVTGKAEQSYSKTDQALSWGVTFTGFHDTILGTSEVFYFAGPGWKSRLALMGFEE